MDVLLRGEVVLLLVLLTVAAVAVLTTLDTLQPTARRRVPRARPASRPAPMVPAVPAPVAPPIPIPEDRATTALRVSGKLRERALQESDPSSATRLTLLHRAIACLQRGLEAAPADPRLSEALAAVRAALGQTERSAVA